MLLFFTIGFYSRKSLNIAIIIFFCSLGCRTQSNLDSDLKLNPKPSTIPPPTKNSSNNTDSSVSLENVKNAEIQINIGPIKTVGDLTLANINILTTKDAKEILNKKNQGKLDTIKVNQNIWDELQKKASQQNNDDIYEPIPNDITELIREKYINSGRTYLINKYFPFFAIYKDGKIHGYILATMHVVHRDFYSDFPDEIKEIISKADKVYLESFPKDAQRLVFSNALHAAGFDYFLKPTFLSRIKETKPGFYAWFMDMNKKMKKLYSLNKLNDPNFSVAVFKYIIDFLACGFNPSDFVSPENEVSRIIKNNNIAFDSLDKPEKDESDFKEFGSISIDYAEYLYEILKNKNVLVEDAFNFYLDTSKNTTGSNIRFGDKFVRTDVHIKKFIERHSVWIPKILSNKNSVFCFGSSHLFIGGEKSIVSQLKNNGFEIKNYYAEKVLEKVERKIRDNSFTLDDFNTLSQYPFYQAKILSMIMNANKKEPETPNTINIKRKFLECIERAKEEKFKIGYTESDLNDLLTKFGNQ